MWPGALADSRRARPDSLQEGGQLIVESLGTDPPLEDRVGLDQAGRGYLLGQHPGVAERVQGIGRVADDQGRLGYPAPLLAVRRRLAQQQALEDGQRGPGPLPHGVEPEIDQGVSPRHQRGEPREPLEQRPGDAQPQHQRGEQAGHRGQRVVEHRHLDEQALDPVGIVGRELQRDVGAQRGPADHRRLQPEVVEQRLDLAREQRHRVEPQVLGAVGAAVAEQVDRDHPVALAASAGPRRSNMWRLSSRPWISTSARSPVPYSS